MKVATVSGSCRLHTAGRSSFVMHCIVAMFLAAFRMFAQAQGINAPDSANTVSSVISSVPYLADPTFHSGRYYNDAFAGNLADYRQGKKIVRLANGDVVVAGVVPAFSGSGNPAINLGLVRYNAAGQRVAWTNPGSYGFNSNSYVIFPNSVTADSTNEFVVNDVLDMQLLDDRIFVLVENDRRIGPATFIYSAIYVFGTDGQLKNLNSYVFDANPPEYAGGMVVFNQFDLHDWITRIAVVGSTFNGVWRPMFRLGQVHDDSAVTWDPVIFPNPGNYCPTNRGCILRSIAPGGLADSSSPPQRLYLGGSRQSHIPDDQNWDFLVMAFSPNGTPDTTFGNGGVTTIPFDDGGDDYDDIHSIVVTPGANSNHPQDQIYATGFVKRECNDGIGIAKLAVDGTLDSSFGDITAIYPQFTRSGKLIVGGVGGSPGGLCNILGGHADYANASALANGKLAIAGYTVYRPGTTICISGQPCPEDNVDGELTVIDTAFGNIDSFRSYPYSDTVGGPRSRHSGFWGITAGDDGTFTATGDVRFFQSAPGQPAGTKQYGTIRLRSDRIFANNFDIGNH